MPKPTAAQLKEMQEAEQAVLDGVRALSLQSTWVMATEVLWPKTWRSHYWEPYHRRQCDLVDASGWGARKLFKNFRSSRKTMLLTIAHDVRRIAADPNIRILLITALDNTAKLLASLIKKQFQENEGFRLHFPDLAFPKDRHIGTQYGFEHPARTNTALLDPTLSATYLGAPLIGRRADIIDLDDPIAEDMVATPDLARKTNNQINELLPLLDPASKYNMMFIKATPKSHMDYYALASGGGGETKSEDEVEKPKAVFDVTCRAALEDKDGNPDINGEPTLPNVHTRDSLMKVLEQAKLDPQQGESYFWREYMCQVQAPGDVKFQPEWFDTWVDKLPSNVIRTGLSIDSATKDEQVLFRGDYSVVLCGHFDAYGHLYLTDGARSNGWKSADLKRELLGMAQRGGGISNVLKEKVGEGSAFGQMREWFNEARMPYTPYPLTVRGMGKKMVRLIEMLQPAFQARHIHFVKGFPMDVWQALKDELTHLGMWSHDDTADALSLFFHPDFRVQISANKTSPWKPLYNLRPGGISRNWHGRPAIGELQLDETGAVARDLTLENNRSLAHTFHRALGIGNKPRLD